MNTFFFWARDYEVPASGGRGGYIEADCEPNDGI